MKYTWTLSWILAKLFLNGYAYVTGMGRNKIPFLMLLIMSLIWAISVQFCVMLTTTWENSQIALMSCFFLYTTLLTLTTLLTICNSLARQLTCYHFFNLVYPSLKRDASVILKPQYICFREKLSSKSHKCKCQFYDKSPIYWT